MVSVLHTFGSDLKYHPHIHMLVTGGGMDLNQNEIELDVDYLTRQRFLANLFRKLFLSKLLILIKNQKIALPKNISNSKIRFNKWKDNLYKKQWIVNIEQALKDIFQIVGYVGRYTKRACISEYRIVDIKNNFIYFQYNDYANSKRGEKPNIAIKKMYFVEFLDKLLQHVPDKRYRTVRYSGMYNSHYIRKNNNQLQITDIDIEKLDNTQWNEFVDYRKLCIQKGENDPLICQNCNYKMEFDEIIFVKNRFIDDS